jgi:hypothetical protein
MCYVDYTRKNTRWFEGLTAFLLFESTYSLLLAGTLMFLWSCYSNNNKIIRCQVIQIQTFTVYCFIFPFHFCKTVLLTLRVSFCMNKL